MLRDIDQERQLLDDTINAQRQAFDLTLHRYESLALNKALAAGWQAFTLRIGEQNLHPETAASAAAAHG